MLYIIGKSGSGKDTMLKKLKDEFSDLEEIVLYTTRPMREGEVDGVQYHFIDDVAMDNIEKNSDCEVRKYKTVAGVWRYATVYTDIKDLNKVVAVGPLELYRRYKNKFNSDITVVYLKVNREVLEERLNKRDKIEGESKRRLDSDDKDFMDVEKIPNLIVVDNTKDIDITYNKIRDIYKDLRK